jgi:uncharacterized protein
MTVNRRDVMRGMVAGLVAAGVPLNGQDADPSASKPAERNYRIWDVHSHLEALPGDTPEARIELLVRHMDRLGVERLILSQGFGQYEYHATPEQVRIENDRVMQAVKHFPDRAYGSLYLNPEHTEFCLEEFDRCVRDGPMVNIGEIETDVRCNSPLLDPIVERAVALNVPFCQHTWINSLGDGPGESSPFDVVELARRHPKGKFVCMHTGGNWEIGIRAIRDCENVWAEIAGSDPTAGFTEMAVRELGAERVIYGSDVGGRSFGSQVAKVLGANISDQAKELILGGNLRRLLQPVLQAKGMAS